MTKTTAADFSVTVHYITGLGQFCVRFHGDDCPEDMRGRSVGISGGDGLADVLGLTWVKGWFQEIGKSPGEVKRDPDAVDWGLLRHEIEGGMRVKYAIGDLKTQAGGLTEGLSAQGENLAAQSHYKGHASGVEPLTVCEHLPFNLGCTVKYIFRQGAKPTEDEARELTKAALYLDRELYRRGISMPDYQEFRKVPGKQIGAGE